MEEIIKSCGKCKLNYPIENYRKYQRLNEITYSNTCKNCSNEMDKLRKINARRIKSETILANCEMCNEEKTLNPNQSILGQRKYWCKDPGMEDKMTIVRKPVEWYSPGFHMSKPDVPRDPDLYNIHLHKCDFDQTNCRRNTKTNSVTWATGSGPTADGFHTWIQDNNLKNHWYQDAFKTGISLIPTKFHGII